LNQRIEFQALWPSLRATVIQQIYNEFPEGIYHDHYLPVQWILQISYKALRNIMTDNDRTWATVVDIPEHLVGCRSEHSGIPIDPDCPPARELVQAIRFLKQEHLPVNILGEWQFKLPDLEVFQALTMFPPSFRPQPRNTENIRETIKDFSNDY
jgi:hypothetical protein